MSVIDTRDLPRLDMILYDRPAGRNIIGHAVDTIKRLRQENADLKAALRKAGLSYPPMED